MQYYVYANLLLKYFYKGKEKLNLYKKNNAALHAILFFIRKLDLDNFKPNCTQYCVISGKNLISLFLQKKISKKNSIPCHTQFNILEENRKTFRRKIYGTG